MRNVLTVLGVFLLLGLPQCPARGLEQPRKKLIEYGWDSPDPEFVYQHIQEMERRPFDGIIFRLHDFNHAFDPQPWDEAKLRSQFAALKAIRWRNFTDNFLCLYAANENGMDWFNEDHWKAILANLRLTAKAAKLGRCVGVAFDPEPYGPNPWAYSGRYAGRTFAEVSGQVRRRGAQFMAALQGQMPALRLLTFFQLSEFSDLVDDLEPKTRLERLAQRPYALLPAFLMGILESAGPGTRIVDGNEPSYYAMDAKAYLRGYGLIKERALSLISPENRAKYRTHVQAGMAVYLDQVLALRKPEDQFPSYYLSQQERLRWLEHNVYWALSTTDEYVWCDGERMSWWENRIPEGVEAAIRSARAKVAGGEPLGFDIESSLAGGRRKLDGALASRITPRSATLHPLAPDEQPPKIDGSLEDAVWQHHRSFEAFLPTAASRRDKPAVATTAWVTYDEGSLYVALRCEEPDVEHFQVAEGQTQADSRQGNFVELFLSLGETSRPYRRFAVKLLDAQQEGASLAEADATHANVPYRHAVKIGQKEWAAEFAIPWASLGGRPRPGCLRKANLCRQSMPTRDLSTWSVVVRDFNEAERFGVWKFAE